MNIKPGKKIAATKPNPSVRHKTNSYKNVYLISLIFIFAIVVSFFAGILSTYPRTYQCPSCPNNQNSTNLPDKTDDNNANVSQNTYNGYANYEPPLYPTYTESWPIIISKVNNFLFLHPEGFDITSGSDQLFVPVILKNPSSDAEIIVQRLEDVNSYDESQQFNQFLNSINSGVQVQKYGYIINPPKISPTSQENGYGVLEQNIDTKKVYQSIYFMNDGWYETVVIRTRNLKADDLRAIYESFKFLRH